MSASDGYYFDKETTPGAVVRRNLDTAWNTIQTGEAGGVAVGVVLGAIVSVGLRRVARMFDVGS